MAISSDSDALISPIRCVGVYLGRGRRLVPSGPTLVGVPASSRLSSLSPPPEGVCESVSCGSPPLMLCDGLPLFSEGLKYDAHFLNTTATNTYVQNITDTNKYVQNITDTNKYVQNITDTNRNVQNRTATNTRHSKQNCNSYKL